ncbi:MAG: ComEC/Rec2 family competence protein, partial [Persicimonas sp.]
MEAFRQPLTALALLVIAAVSIALSLGDPPPQIGPLAALGWAALIAHVWQTSRRDATTIAAAGLLLTAVILARGGAFDETVTELREAMSGERMRGVVEARVIGVGPRTPNGDTLEVEIERRDGASFEAGAPRVQLFVPPEAGAARGGEATALPGDRIEGFVRFEPYPERALPGQPSLSRQMAYRGIAARAAALEPIEVTPDDPSLAEAIARRLVRTRLAFEHHLLESLGAERAPLAIALTTANKSYLEPEVSEPFRRTGTGHLLAISGLHLGVLAALLWWLFGRLVDRSRWLLRRFGRRRACGLAVMVALGAYVALIGAPVSAVRAWVAVSLGIGALLLLRPICPFHALAAAALGLMAWNPMVVTQLGFQLSFAATLGILLFVRFRPPILEPPAAIMDEPEPALRRWLRRLGLFVGVSTSATLATWPVVAANLGQVQVAGLWTNLFATPVVSALLFPALVVGVIASLVWQPAGVWILELAVDGLLVLRDVLAAVAELPASRIITGVPPAWAIVAMVAGV